MLRQINIAMLLSFTMLFTACGDKGSENTDTTTAQAELKKMDFIIDWQPEPTYLGIYYALDTKEFEKIGYDMSIQTSWGAHQAVAAIASGKYAIGTASGGATVLARSNGTPIKSLGVLYNDIPSVIYGLSSKTMAKSPKDIEGMKVGIYPGSITNDEFEAFVKANELNMSKITKVALSGGDIPILKSGEVDAVLNYTEMSPAVVDVDESFKLVEGKRTWRLHLKEHGVKSYGLNIITSDKAFAQSAKELDKITQAVYNGYTNACKNPTDAVEKFIKRFPDKDTKNISHGFKLVCEQLTSPMGIQTVEGWDKTIKLFDGLNLLKSPVEPESLMGNIK